MYRRHDRHVPGYPHVHMHYLRLGAWLAIDKPCTDYATAPRTRLGLPLQPLNGRSEFPRAPTPIPTTREAAACINRRAKSSKLNNTYNKYQYHTMGSETRSPKETETKTPEPGTAEAWSGPVATKFDTYVCFLFCLQDAHGPPFSSALQWLVCLSEQARMQD
jgi:hypothetical protein